MFLINHYKDPYQPSRIQWKVTRVYISWLRWEICDRFLGGYWLLVSPFNKAPYELPIGFPGPKTNATVLFGESQGLPKVNYVGDFFP